jgi:hypothetical protein
MRGAPAGWRGTSDDQFACIAIHRFASRSGPPTPAELKALAMPLDHSGWLHQHHRFEAPRPHPVQPHPDQPIDEAQPQTARTLTIEDRDLMTKGDEFEFQFRPAANPTSQLREECRDECEHADDITDRPVKLPGFSPLSGFSAGTTAACDRA